MEFTSMKQLTEHIKNWIKENPQFRATRNRLFV